MSTIYKPRRLPHNTHCMNEPLGLGNPVSIDTAFKVLVRPILENVCAVWNPYLVKNIYAIESVQRRASRLICGSGKECTERLGELKWDSLELRRKYLSLVQNVHDFVWVLRRGGLQILRRNRSITNS